MMDVIRSEWTKMRSVRSTMWTLLVTALLMIGFGALLSFATKANAEGQPIAALDAARAGLSGVTLASLSIAALGVLVISGEYRTGGIRMSLLAVPRRLRLLAGKIIVFTVAALVVCTATAGASVLVGFAVMRPAGGDGGAVARTIVGAGLYLTACGLFGLAFGALVRHTPGALLSVIGMILVLPQLVRMLPGEWARSAHHYVTTNAGLQVITPAEANPLGPWAGYAVYLAWIAAAMLAAAVLMNRRDA
uniref:ABC transporter permease n=1 Tax=Nonomuraea pusilla TaxID=46177 RepID=UPI0009E90856|nr:ABC transporter permease [Nonomuraea pusilla]